MERIRFLKYIKSLPQKPGHCVKKVRIRSFPGRIFPHSGQKKIRIRTLFTQCEMLKLESRNIQIFLIKVKGQSHIDSSHALSHKDAKILSNPLTYCSYRHVYIFKKNG